MDETIPPTTTGDATTAPPTTATPPSTTTAARGADTTTTSTTAPTTTTTTTTEAPGPLTIEIDYRDGEVDGPDEVEVELAERVIIIVTGDVEDEVHLHGYNVFADVGPSSAAVIEFDANVPGIFEVELEDAGKLLVEIVVS